MERGLPGCCSPGRQNGLGHAHHEAEWVLPGEDGVDKREDDEGVDKEAGQHRHHVVGQLFKHGVQILHLHQFSGD